MFGNTVAHRRAMKKNALLEKLDKAKKENNEWKVNQLEGKIADFERRCYPKYIWESSKGTYKKPEGDVANENNSEG